MDTTSPPDGVDLPASGDVHQPTRADASGRADHTVVPAVTIGLGASQEHIIFSRPTRTHPVGRPDPAPNRLRRGRRTIAAHLGRATTRQHASYLSQLVTQQPDRERRDPNDVVNAGGEVASGLPLPTPLTSLHAGPPRDRQPARKGPSRCP
jgi:hypothetical protein